MSTKNKNAAIAVGAGAILGLGILVLAGWGGEPVSDPDPGDGDGDGDDGSDDGGGGDGGGGGGGGGSSSELDVPSGQVPGQASRSTWDNLLPTQAAAGRLAWVLGYGALPAWDSTAPVGANTMRSFAKDYNAVSRARAAGESAYGPITGGVTEGTFPTGSYAHFAGIANAIRFAQSRTGQPDLWSPAAAGLVAFIRDADQGGFAQAQQVRNAIAPYWDAQADKAAAAGLRNP